jgi:hypothetical protein
LTVHCLKYQERFCFEAFTFDIGKQSFKEIEKILMYSGNDKLLRSIDFDIVIFKLLLSDWFIHKVITL